MLADAEVGSLTSAHSLHDSSERTLLVRGGHPLYGQVQVAGFKHVLVLALSYMIASGRTGVLRNAPDILETLTYLKLLPDIGIRASWHDREMRIGTLHNSITELPASAGDIHGSLYLLPALLARHGEVRFGAFGGCPIGGEPGGGRPWRHAAGVLQRFGAQLIENSHGRMLVTDGLRPADIDLLEFTSDSKLRSGPEYSGATKTAVLAAALAQGTSALRHPYAKFEVLRLLDFIESVGVPVVRYTDRWEIGPAAAHGGLVSYTLPADLLEVVTWVTVSALGGGRIDMSGVSYADIAEGLAPELELWRSIGIELRQASDDSIFVRARSQFGGLDVVDVSPSSLYSDAQPLFAALAIRCPGQTRIVDRVWGNRFGYLNGLHALGVDITKCEGGILVGQSEPHADPGGVTVRASDLRAAAALLCVALTTRSGPVIFHGAHHLDRGYEGLVEKMRNCHADLVDLS